MMNASAYSTGSRAELIGPVVTALGSQSQTPWFARPAVGGELPMPETTWAAPTWRFPGLRERTGPA
jgi:hypothetical protein